MARDDKTHALCNKILDLARRDPSDSAEVAIALMIATATWCRATGMDLDLFMSGAKLTYTNIKNKENAS